MPSLGLPELVVILSIVLVVALIARRILSKPKAKDGQPGSIPSSRSLVTADATSGSAQGVPAVAAKRVRIVPDGEYGYDKKVRFVVGSGVGADYDYDIQVRVVAEDDPNYDMRVKVADKKDFNYDMRVKVINPDDVPSEYRRWYGNG